MAQFLLVLNLRLAELRKFIHLNGWYPNAVRIMPEKRVLVCAVSTERKFPPDFLQWPCALSTECIALQIEETDRKIKRFCMA